MQAFLVSVFVLMNLDYCYVSIFSSVLALMVVVNCYKFHFFFKICITKNKHLLFHRKKLYIGKYKITLGSID